MSDNDEDTGKWVIVLNLQFFSIIIVTAKVKTKQLIYVHWLSQDENSDLHPHLYLVSKCKCHECNTFAIVRIHVQKMKMSAD